MCQTIGNFLFSLDIELVELALLVLFSSSKSSSSIISSAASDVRDGIEVSSFELNLSLNALSVCAAFCRFQAVLPQRSW